MTAVDQWSWWRAACNGTIGPIREAEPQSGFFRDHTGEPVAIWRAEDGSVIALVGAESFHHPVKQGKIWLSVAKHPVSKSAYDFRIASGGWPADLPPVASASAVRGAGDNSGSLSDYDRMRAEILGDVAEAEAYYARRAVDTKDEADKAQDWGDRLVKASRAADAARLKENEPLRAQIAENDKKWKAIVDPALSRGNTLRGLADAWGKAETARLQKEAQEKARQEWQAEQDRIAAERRQREAGAAAHAVQQEHVDADGVIHDDPKVMAELPLSPPPPLVAPPPKVMVGTGTYGNRRSVKTTAPETATITDLSAAAAFYAAQKHPELVALVQKLADRAIKARAEIPGVRFSWQKNTEAA